MSSPYALRLETAPTGPGPAAPLPDLPSDVPAVIDRAGLLINHSLLAAEILGIPTGELTWRLEAVWGVPEEMRTFDQEDASVMDDLFGRIEAALGDALDEEGGPSGEPGGRLAASSHLGLDGHGRLYFHSHRLAVRDLREELAHFRRFLRFAAQHALRLRVE